MKVCKLKTTHNWTLYLLDDGWLTSSGVEGLYALWIGQKCSERIVWACTSYFILIKSYFGEGCENINYKVCKCAENYMSGISNECNQIKDTIVHMDGEIYIHFNITDMVGQVSQRKAFIRQKVIKELTVKMDDKIYIYHRFCKCTGDYTKLNKENKCSYGNGPICHEEVKPE